MRANQASALFIAPCLAAALSIALYSTSGTQGLLTTFGPDGLPLKGTEFTWRTRAKGDNTPKLYGTHKTQSPSALKFY